MTLSTDFNVDPYYDDYDETKGFSRILFRPGYAVQAREVTQLQTILQKQIERHGQHLFEEGSVVLGCELNYDNKVKSVKLETQFSGVDVSITNFANKIITGAASNARGKIVSTSAATAADQPTLMFQYLNDNTFNDGETLTAEGTTYQANTVSSTGASGITGAIANGSVASMNSGVFYVGGFFVFKDAETLILEKYSDTPSYRIGIQVTETIPTADSDTTLLDPAQGAYNYAARGATRYKIALALSAKTFSATDAVEAAADENFFQLLKVSSGKKVAETKYPVYTELEKTLARRTHDESGDYTITPFNLELASHQGLSGLTGTSPATNSLVGVNTLFDTELKAGDVVYLSGNTDAISVVSAPTTNTVVSLDTALDTGTAGQRIFYENKFSAGLEPGKAYVKGYEYESISTKYVTVDKGRDTTTIESQGLNTSFGNFLHIKQANGMFDITKDALIDLHCTDISTQNVASNADTTAGSLYSKKFEDEFSQTKIGTARVRDIDFHSTSANSANVTHSHSDYVIHLYDVRTANVKTGNVADANLSSTIIHVGNTGTTWISRANNAYDGATITVTTPVLDKIILESSTAGLTGVTYLSQENGNTDSSNTGTPGLIVRDAQTGTGTYTEGSVSYTTSYVIETRQIDNYIANTTAGFAVCNTAFTERGNFVADGTGAMLYGSTFDIKFQIKDIDSISVSNNTHRTADAEIDELSRYNFVSTANTVLQEPGRNSLVFPLPDTPIAGTTKLTYTYKTIKKDVAVTSGTSEAITLTGNEEFPVLGSPLTSSQAQENFVVIVQSVSEQGTPSTDVGAGQYLNFSNTDGFSRSITTASKSATISANSFSGVVDVVMTVKKAITASAGDTPSGKTIVAGNGNTSYANLSSYETLTLQSEYTGTGAAAPSEIDFEDQLPQGQYHITTPTKIVGEKIVLPTADVFNIVKVVDSGDPTKNVTSTMMVATANNIANSYVLDTGQADNVYDLSAIILKAGQSAPKGQICVVFDRFSHGSGGFFSANSYPIAGTGREFNNDANTFTYTDIPDFTSPTTGESVRLSDVIDFRPIVKPDELSESIVVRYYFANNTDALQTLGSGVATGGIITPDPEATSSLDYSFYLPRIDKLTLSRDRQFGVLKGKPTQNPVAPPDDDDSMTLYTLSVPAYTFSLSNIATRYIDNKRFTMRDIGKLEKRIERLEYFTALNILEKETAAREITAAGGKDSLFNPQGTRFKSGILVDSFAGHSIGDVVLDDYNSSIHFSEKQLRAPFYYDNFRFTYDSASSNNTVKTGDLITLPYTNTALVEQPLRYDSIGINPFNVVNFIGSVKTDPVSDTWFDQTTRPTVTTNLEGHHDAWLLSPSSGRRGFGSQWDDWSVNWTGKQINPEPKGAVANVGTITTGTRSTKLIGQSKSKFGITSDNPIETIVKSVGNRVLDMSVVPYVRAQRITFSTKGLRPLTNVYTFIGSTDMSANTEPAKKLVLGSANGAFQEGEVIKDSADNEGIVRISSNTVSNVATIYITNIVNSTVSNSTIGFPAANVVTGQTSGANGTITTITANTRGILSSSISQMQTNDQGEISGDIDVPAGTFRAGDRIVRITDNSTDNVVATTTVAESLFKVKGLLQNRDKLLISTREAIIRRESIVEEEIVTDTTSRQTEQTNWVNPLSQTFFVDPSSYPMGVFLRSIDLNFYAKDVNLPVTVQIRPLVNGFPSSSLVLPFSEVTINPDNITANTTGATATTFAFDSPVYLTPDEYAVVMLTNSSEYSLWSGKIGQNVTGTTRKITHQPYVGRLFRTQNAGVWQEDVGRNLVFQVNRCNFIGTGGSNNYSVFTSYANGANSNTANVTYQTFKVTTSKIEFSNTTSTFQYNSANGSSGAMLGYVNFDPDQNINLIGTRQLTATSNGKFLVNCSMSTANSHVSPVLDLDRLSVITIENDIDDGSLTSNTITINNSGTGYTNVSPSAYTVTISAPDTSNGITTTSNVHVEVTMNVVANSSALSSANAAYTTGSNYPSQFVIGEGVRIVANNANGDVTQTVQPDPDGYGVVSAVTYYNDDSTLNVTSITIKTVGTGAHANRANGHFVNGTIVFSDLTAQGLGSANTGVTASSNTYAAINKVTGIVANIVTTNSIGSIAASGSGYLTTPTVTVSAPTYPITGINATAIVAGENAAKGGNINAKYISRRVSLEDGFDASDLKVIVNAYKPLGTNVHVYYKVKHVDDPEDFDAKTYTLMVQETPIGEVSKAEADVKEFTYKTSDDIITYTSNNVTYDLFKYFSVKVALTSNNASVIPKVRDMRAIAVD